MVLLSSGAALADGNEGVGICQPINTLAAANIADEQEKIQNDVNQFE